MKIKKILPIFKFIVAILLISVLYREINQGDKLLLAFRSANLFYIALAVLLLIPNYFVQFLKWRYILRIQFPSHPNSDIIQSLLFGSTIGFLTPGNLGELSRAVWFHKYDKMKIAGLNILDKVYGNLVFITLGFFSLFVITITRLTLSPFILLPTLVLGSTFLFIVWLLMINPGFTRSLINSLKRRITIPRNIKGIFSWVNYLKRKHSIVMSLYGIGWFVIILFQYHILVLAFEYVSLLSSCLAVSAILVTKIVLPISFADLGIREGASVFYFTLFNVSSASAFNSALLIFIINFLLPAIVGSFFVFRLKGDQNKQDL
jgi:uncharacterized protein (TIRG00374 family)